MLRHNMQKRLINTPYIAQNIYCIGRNYIEHAKELNNPVPSSPVVFLKPTSSISYNNESLIIPAKSKRVDHEVEIVVVIGLEGKNIEPDQADKHISHIGIGLDFTARDLQDEAKAKALPWTIAKGFDTFAGLSDFVSYDRSKVDLKNLNFNLTVNGEIKQSGNTQNMIFDIAYLVSYLSSIFTLVPGDIIFTGTPKGVGILKAGDKMEATLENLTSLKLTVK
jgi:2-keto-4-pentenoate hydratase/2-oxohepta-3-ene-1,7-dioic acid hydratase in catechol pathway